MTVERRTEASVARGTLIVLSAPSGAGKSSLVPNTTYAVPELIPLASDE